MPQPVVEFMRYSAPDAAQLSRQIDDMRRLLAQAVSAGDSLAIVDHVADLGSMLTTARQESEALTLLQAHVALAERHAAHEPSGWFWNSLATALQYTGNRELADTCFHRAVQLSRAAGWQRLLAQALHHWGRCLVEQRRFAQAEQCMQEALAIRVQLGEPRQSSTRQALQVLAQLRQADANGAA